MLEYVKGDLFKDKHPVIVHGCNSMGVMGSGFAIGIKNRYPDAYERYHSFCNSYDSVYDLMGKVCYWYGKDTIIANCITQEKYGRDGKRYVSYDALDKAMADLALTLNDGPVITHIAMPKIGAGLGGGHWDIIEQIVKLHLDDFDVRIYEL